MKNRFTVKNFGENLRAARKERGFPQESFALTVDLDHTYIGGIERGDRNPLRLDQNVRSDKNIYGGWPSRVTTVCRRL